MKYEPSYEFSGKVLLPTQAPDQDSPTGAVGPQQRHDLLRLAEHHHTSMKMLFEDLHYLTELKNLRRPCAGTHEDPPPLASWNRYQVEVFLGRMVLLRRY